MGMASELMGLDVQIFRLQAELAKAPTVEGTKKLQQLLKSRQQLLLKLEREEREDSRGEGRERRLRAMK